MKTKTIKEIRISKQLTQLEASSIVGLQLRTYQNYESGKSYRDTFKINQIINILNNYERITETKGILTIKEIEKGIKEVCDKYKVHYVYLFGSYAKNCANEKSDIDLLVDCDEKGLNFLSLSEEFHTVLHKYIDVIRFNDLEKNMTFLNEILRTGVKIYSGKVKR